MKTAEELQAELDAVAGKNAELLKELKAAKAKAKSAADIDPERFAALESENEELKASLAKIEKAGKSETEKLTKALESEKSFTRQLLVENGLTDAATKAGVKAEYMPAVRALLASQVQVIEEGDKRVAKIGDKAVSDFVSAWAQSDEGKHYVAAPANSGGGAPGSNGAAGGNTMKRDAFSQLPPADQMAFAKGGGKLTD